MAEAETTSNVVTKYLGQFACEVLEPVGIEYQTKRTGKSRLIKLMKMTAVTEMTANPLYRKSSVTAVIAVTKKRKDLIL